ncbi:MAG: hypothetical protein HYX32_12350 [Actinobacteria bacterium]|nr:hypothetical protein [Actinomycetota bacterium]
MIAPSEYADSHTLTRYEATAGYEALRKVIAMAPNEVLEEVTDSGLTGRSGGAAFSTGLKWSLAASGLPRYVVVNGDEASRVPARTASSWHGTRIN